MKLVLTSCRRALLPWAGAAMLSACVSSSGLHPVSTPIAAASLRSQRALAGVKVDAAAWPPPKWWQAAGDPQLDRLVSEALTDNPDMTLVAARVRAALAATGAVAALRRPTVNGGASAAGARVPPLLPPIANGHFGWIDYGYLSFKWSPDLAGGKRAASEAAVDEARASELDAQEARLELSADVVQAYFDLAGAYVQRDLRRAEHERAQSFLDLTRTLVARGIANRLSLAQVEGEVATDSMRLKDAENAVRTGGLVLSALLGKGPDYALGVQRPALPAPQALVLPSDLPADLLGRRPDVVAARWRVEAADRDIRVAKAKFLPNLSISSLAGLIAPSSMDLFALSSRFYTIAPALSLPLFAGGALRANLAGKDAARDIAVGEYNRTLVQAINQVATQVDDLRSLSSQVGDAEVAQGNAATAYRLSMQRFRAGIGSFLEALTVRQQLIGAEQQLADVKLRRSDAWVRLNEQLGGGFQPAAAARPLVTTTSAAPSADKVP